MTKSHFNLLQILIKYTYGPIALRQTSYSKENSWTCILHQYHKASTLKSYTMMCRKWGKYQIYFVNSRWRRTSTSRFFLMYLTKFDAKITKMKQNYMANMIMNVSGTVGQLIHYFLGKQGLAINLPWPALKSKQRIELFDIIGERGRGAKKRVLL